MTDTVVYLDNWHHPVYGDRWTICRDDARVMPILTFSTEAEARAAAERFGWRVADEGDGLGDGR
jgi:hypothetical protein